MVAAERSGIDKLRSASEAEGVRTSVLKVTSAFHSPHMAPILDDLHGLARSLRFSQPSIPYFSCLTGAPASDELFDGEYCALLDVCQHVLRQLAKHFIEHLQHLGRLEPGRQDARQLLGDGRMGGEEVVKAVLGQLDEASGSRRPHLVGAPTVGQRLQSADDITGGDSGDDAAIMRGRVALQNGSELVQARTVDGPQQGTVRGYRVPVAVIPSGKISFQAVRNRFISSSVPIETRK